MNVEKIPTLREIATSCGFNASTVSRALNNNPNLPPETRLKIRQVAEGMGWRPNPLAAAYMSHLRSTRPNSYKANLAFVVDYPIAKGARKNLPGHVLRSFQGAQAGAAAAGYDLTLFSLADEDFKPAMLGRILYSRSIPGVVFGYFEDQDRSLEGFPWNQFAVACMGYNLNHHPMHRVVNHVHRGFEQIINKAFELGYRRLGVIVSEEYDKRVGNGVLHTYYYHQRHLLEGQRLDLFLVKEPENASLYTKIEAWLRKVRPDAITGICVAPVLEKMGWYIPGDIAYISVDRDPSYIAHAGLDQRHDILGRQAVEVLISQLNLNQRGLPDHPIHHVVKGEWVDGPSAPRVLAEVRKKRRNKVDFPEWESV